MAELGGSLPVPSVIEIAKEAPTAVPSRFLYPDQDSPVILDTISLPQVPVIDMQKLLSGNFMDTELEMLHHACKEWGFFQLLNHGVDTSLVEKMKLEIQDFYNLPMEGKKPYAQQPGDLEGFGQAYVVSDEQKLTWVDSFFIISLPTHLRKPRLFSKLPISFRDTLEAYSAELNNLSLEVLYLMGKALRMDPNDMKELFEEGLLGMRMNYYPPCPQPELAIGLNPHSDGNGLTILLQINEMEGLQIKKDGMWIPIKPLPNAFIINLGDILEIVTNGIYRSIEHRAIVNSVKERISIATFHSPKFGGDLGPAPSLITPESPALFKRISVENYFKGFFSRELRGKSYLDVMRIQNDEEDKTS